LRLYLPESWTSDTARMDRASVPEDFRAYRTNVANGFTGRFRGAVAIRSTERWLGGCFLLWDGCLCQTRTFVPPDTNVVIWSAAAATAGRAPPS
jgi:hypothetical protein